MITRLNEKKQRDDRRHTGQQNGYRLKDFVPEGLVARSMLIRKRELWMLETPDEEVERDYFRLFRVVLKSEHID